MQIAEPTVHTFRDELTEKEIVPFIGIYDILSASIAGQHYDSLFISGFGFAASHYGLPDIGFISWPDIVAFVQRVRTVLPRHHLLVDIDDGYGDKEIAAHVVSVLESVGATGVVLEDQRRPRRCGHFNGKLLLAVDEYVEKLSHVLAARQDLFVIARTDASDFDDILRRVDAYTEAGADAILVDGVPNLDLLRVLSQRIDRPVAFNQIAGGKSPACSLTELKEAGARIAIYSTPCLFAAQEAVQRAVRELGSQDGLLYGPSDGAVGVPECTTLLMNNMMRRSERW